MSTATQTHTKTIVSALFDDDDVLLHAVKKLRGKGYYIREAYTPFPVHGLDHAMGLKPTNIGTAAFFYGLMGLSLAIWLTYYTMIHDWPMNIGGKPSFTWGKNMPAFVPVMFELTVFFAAHLMVWTFFAVNGLYPGRKPINPDPRTTDDKFMIEVEANGDADALIELLKNEGAIEINKKEEETNGNHH